MHIIKSLFASYYYHAYTILSYLLTIILIITANNHSDHWRTYVQGGVVRRTYIRNQQELIQSKNVSPLNRIYPRPVGLKRRQELRQARAAARNRIGYRWRCRRRDLKRIRESLLKDEGEITHESTNVDPVNQATVDDSLRREGDDTSWIKTEVQEAESDTFQGDVMDLS